VTADGADDLPRRRNGQRAYPWLIHYQPFNYEVHNGLHRPAPLLEFRYG
jgi:hypothetical protein